MNKNEIVIFETEDKMITLPVAVDNEMVWLNRNQMAELFGRDVKTIGKHINNALREELEGQVVVAKFATVQKEGERHDDKCDHELYVINDKCNFVGFEDDKIIRIDFLYQAGIAPEKSCS